MAKNLRGLLREELNTFQLMSIISMVIMLHPRFKKIIFSPSKAANAEKRLTTQFCLMLMLLMLRTALFCGSEESMQLGKAKMFAEEQCH